MLRVAVVGWPAERIPVLLRVPGPRPAFRPAVLSAKLDKCQALRGAIPLCMVDDVRCLPESIIDRKVSSHA